MEPTLISLYSGCGGSAKGFDDAGFKIIFMNDKDKDACESLRLNFKNGSEEIVHEGDITKQKIAEKIRQIGKATVIEGGFPCQGFSMAGPRKVDDKRNMLYKHLKQAIEDTNPKFFVAENVKGFVTIGEYWKKAVQSGDGWYVVNKLTDEIMHTYKGKDAKKKANKKVREGYQGPFFKNGKIVKFGKVAQAIIDELENIGKGYRVECRLLNAKNYGLPQDRERIFIVGVRQDLADKGIKFTFPKPTNGPGDYVTMRDYDVDKVSVNSGDIFTEEEKKDYFGSRYMSRNRVKEWNEVSFTIPAEAQQVPAQPGTKMWNTPDGKPPGKKKPRDSDASPYTKNRLKQTWPEFRKQHEKLISKDLKRFSYRQCAKIQGFDDGWKFYPEENNAKALISKYRQIGNAVPPPLMKEIARKIKDCLEKEKVTA